LAHHVPAFVERAAILGEVRGRRLVWRMSGAERQIREERSIGPHTLGIGDHSQQLIDEVLADVIAVVGPAGWRDRVVVAHQIGMELVGLALHEAVEPVEPAAQRPLVERSRRRALLHRREVPFAGAQRGVPLGLQDLGHRGGMVRDVAELMREAGAEVRDGAHPDGVLRATGQQRRARRRAQRSDVKVGELHATCRQRVDVRGVDGAAVATELGETRVVEQNHDDVRSMLTRVRWLLEPRLGIGQHAADATFEPTYLRRWLRHDTTLEGCARSSSGS
jgi:hypothetical protein